MEQIIITHRNGTTLKLNSKENVSAITKATQTVELLGADVVDLSVNSSNKLNFYIGDKITVIGRDYTLNTPARERKLSDREFIYDMQFEGVQYDLLRASFNVNIDTTTNEIQDISGDSITGNIKLFLDVLVSNANRVFGAGKWIVGSHPINSKTITLTFNDSDNCLTVLQSLCGENNFGTEFKIVIDGSGNRTINIGTIGNLFGYTFEYGKGKGLFELNREKQSSSNIITRLNAFGGSKNIITPKYRASKLCLANKSKSQSFIEDATAISTFGIWEGTKEFPETYPSRTGTVSSLGTTVYEFIDISMDFDLNEKNLDGSTKYLMAGTSAKISFNTGNLAGYEFDVSSYDLAKKKFTIISQTDQNDYKFPSETSTAFQVAIGDKYIITDIYMPQSYIDAAESELLTKATAYLAKYSQPLVQYGLTIDSFFLKNQVGADVETNIIWVGDYIPIKDLDLEVNKTIRVKGFTRDLMQDYAYQLTIADLTTTISTINRVISGMNDMDKVVTMNNLSSPAKARRNWKDSQEVLNMIFDTEGDYFTDKIKPLSIETSMLSVGAKSGQFSLEGTILQPNYLSNKNRIVYVGGTLTHYALLDGTENPKQWIISDGDVTLTTDVAHYVYAKCNRTTTSATILFSTDKISSDSDVTFYHFLIGVLNSVDLNNTRALALMYGFTTVNGRFIKTGRLQSSDGLTYFDLDTNEIGGKINFKDGIVSGTVVVGNDLGANAGITGLGDSATGVWGWGGSTYDNMVLGQAKMELKRNGLINFRHPNGQLGFELGIKDGILAFNVYDDTGVLIMEMGSSGIIFANFIPDSWRSFPIIRIPDTEVGTDAEMIAYLKTQINFIDLSNYAAIEINGNTIYYKYSAGKSYDSSDYVIYEKYYFDNNNLNAKPGPSVTKVPDGWYMSETVGRTESLPPGETSGIVTYSINVSVINIFGGEQINTKLLTLSGNHFLHP